MVTYSENFPKISPHLLEGTDNTSLEDPSVISGVFCCNDPLLSILFLLGGCWLYFNNRVCKLANLFVRHGIDKRVVI